MARFPVGDTLTYFFPGHRDVDAISSPSREDQIYFETLVVVYLNTKLPSSQIGVNRQRTRHYFQMMEDC